MGRNVTLAALLINPAYGEFKPLRQFLRREELLRLSVCADFSKRLFNRLSDRIQDGLSEKGRGLLGSFIGVQATFVTV